MNIAVTRHGHKEYGITLEDYTQSVIMQVGDLFDVDGIVLELYEIFDITGLDIKTEDGLFNSDIEGSGVYKLTKVEYPGGALVHK